MPIVEDKPITIVYNTGDPSARTIVTIGLATVIEHPHKVRLLFDDLYTLWYYGGNPISGWQEFTYPLSSSEHVFEARFRNIPDDVMYPPMPYEVSSDYAPTWATIHGDIVITAEVITPSYLPTWLSAWLRPWKVFGV